MRYRQCYVKGCASHQYDHPEEVFFKLPSYENNYERFLKWAFFAQNAKLFNKQMHYRIWLCGKHFTEDCRKYPGASVLRRDAVPTLNPPERDEVILSDHVYSLPLPPTTPTPVEPLSPRSSVSSHLSSQDELDVEILHDEQAQERINQLMKDNNSLIENNLKLKKENIGLKLRNDALKDEIASWRACTKVLTRKASQNLCEDYVRYSKESETLRSLLAKTTEELAELRKVTAKLEEEKNLYLLSQAEDGTSTECSEHDPIEEMDSIEIEEQSDVQFFQADSIADSAEYVEEDPTIEMIDLTKTEEISVPSFQNNIALYSPGNQQVEETDFGDDFINMWTVSDEVEL